MVLRFALTWQCSNLAMKPARLHRRERHQTKGLLHMSRQSTRDSGVGQATVRRKPGPRPGTEAARRGGTAARDKYGSEFYSRIGAKGGSTVRERHGTGFYTEIGRRGGEPTKRNLGAEHYSRIGRIGGRRAPGRRRPVPGDRPAPPKPERPP